MAVQHKKLFPLSSSPTTPDARSYSMVMNAFGKAGKDVVSLTRKNSRPDFRSYSIVIQTWLLLQQQQSKDNLYTEDRYYISRDEAVDHAAMLLNEAREGYLKAGNDEQLKPDPRILHAIVVGFFHAN
jgi:hypothetical protein